MNNPYEVLQIPQDADKSAIIKAKMLALKTAQSRGYTGSDIMLAEKQVLNPAKRLAADFLHPAKLKAKRPQKLVTTIVVKHVNPDDLDLNLFDSL